MSFQKQCCPPCVPGSCCVFQDCFTFSAVDVRTFLVQFAPQRICCCCKRNVSSLFHLLCVVCAGRLLTLRSCGVQTLPRVFLSESEHRLSRVSHTRYPVICRQRWLCFSALVMLSWSLSCGRPGRTSGAGGRVAEAGRSCLLLISVGTSWALHQEGSGLWQQGT